jgi:hypothetical protein
LPLASARRYDCAEWPRRLNFSREVIR